MAAPRYYQPRSELKPELVIVDDDPLDLQSIQLALGDEYTIHAFQSPRAAENFLASRPMHLAVLDLELGGACGLNTFLQWQTKFPGLEVVFCSGISQVERAVECVRRGASDFVAKPFHAETFRSVLRSVRQKRVPHSRALLPSAPVFIGESSAAGKVRAQIKLLRNLPDVKVLILGESGTGKEVVASLLHHQETVLSRSRPFIAVNMAALPTTLVESELFGVERGAFTDAKTSRPGKFELADGGDLFLDEIGDLSLDAQAKLLRALQEKLVQRVGSSHGRRLDFRLISATNLNLSARIRDGHFREDLAFRIADFVLELPPLRERLDDIALLANHFLEKFAPHREMQIGRRVLNQMLRYHWPGNVRQLESTMKRALVLNQGNRVDEVDFLDRIFFSPELPERQQKTLTAAARHPRNRRRAWEELGISKATFYRRLKEIEDN